MNYHNCSNVFRLGAAILCSWLIGSEMDASAQSPNVLLKKTNGFYLVIRPALGDDGNFYATATTNPTNKSGVVSFDSTTLVPLWGPFDPCSVVPNNFGTFGVSIGANGQVYTVGDANECHNGRLVVIAGGSTAWQYDNGSQFPRQAPALDDSRTRLFFGSRLISAVDYNDRTVKWTNIGGYGIGQRGIVLDPGGNLFVSTYKGAFGDCEALSFTPTGVLRWSKFALNITLLAVPAPSTLLINDDMNNLVAWNSSDGSIVWQSAALSNPVTDTAGNIFANSTSTSDIVSLTSTGVERWRKPLTGIVGPQLDFIDNAGHLYVRGGKTLFAINSANGSVAWQLVADASLNVPAALARGGRIYLCDSAGTSYLLDTTLDYAPSTWPVALLGNRRHTQKCGDVLSVPSAFTPVLVSQPTSQFIPVGSNATFSVVATGPQPLSYQWQFNNTPLTNQTNASLFLPSAQPPNGGDYSVIVGNTFGSVTSAVAQLNFLVQTNRQPTTNEIGNPTIPANPNPQLKVFTSGGFQSGISLNSNAMTIVITHGWMDNTTMWVTEMGGLLKSNVVGITPNIVAWDWSKAASNEFLSVAAVTPGQGRALGQALLTGLGSNYSQRIHFIGHSLGTLVNAAAANYLHSDAPGTSPIKAPGAFLPSNTQMTLLDEVTFPQNVIAIGPELLYALKLETAQLLGQPEPTSPYFYSTVPKRAAWVDNYVSLIGLLHTNAANVILTDLTDGAQQVFSAPDFSTFWTAATAYHAYAHTWYNLSISDDTASIMGNRWSFERDGIVNAPAVGSAYVQTPFDNQPLELNSIPYAAGWVLITGRLIAESDALGMSAVNTIPYDTVQIAGQVGANVAHVVVQDAYSISSAAIAVIEMERKAVNLRHSLKRSGSFEG